MEAIKSIDYFLLPLYILLATGVIRALRKKLNPDKTTYKIYYIAFFAKLAGALLFAFIIQYYYGYGDSMTYFDEARVLHNHIAENISNIKYFFTSVEEYKKLYDPAINTANIHLYDTSILLVIRITTILTFLSFNTYLTTTVLLVVISFIGMWAIYRTFIAIAPLRKNQFAWGILYLPSVIFWSSGIMKDSISITFFGLLLYSLYQYFIEKNNRNIYLITIGISCYIIFIIKYYILVAFAITFPLVGIFYLFFRLRPFGKRMLFLFLFITTVLIISTTENFISEFFSQFSAEMISSNIERMQRLYFENKEAGEGNFSLGTITPTMGGIIEKIPQAISTVLYRPFIWESRSLVMFFSGLENLILLSLSLYVFFKAGFINFFKLISQNSIVQFCFFFTIVFATIVGLTTFNFGTLLRYKGPCMPFYTSFLILVNYYSSLQRQKKNLSPG